MFHLTVYSLRLQLNSQSHGEIGCFVRVGKNTQMVPAAPFLRLGFVSWNKTFMFYESEMSAEKMVYVGIVDKNAPDSILAETNIPIDVDAIKLVEVRRWYAIGKAEIEIGVVFSDLGPAPSPSVSLPSSNPFPPPRNPWLQPTTVGSSTNYFAPQPINRPSAKSTNPFLPPSNNDVMLNPFIPPPQPPTTVIIPPENINNPFFQKQPTPAPPKREASLNPKRENPFLPSSTPSQIPPRDPFLPFPPQPDVQNPLSIEPPIPAGSITMQNVLNTAPIPMNMNNSHYNTNGPFGKSELHHPQRDLIIFQSENIVRHYPHIGKGSFGVVFKGKVNGIEDTVVIKDLDIQNQKMIEDWTKEVNLMSQNRSPYIVEIFGYCNQQRHLTIIMEYMAKGDLFTILHKENHHLSLLQRLRMARHCALGVLVLHSRNILHRDVKSLNILVSEDNACKLSDFGCAKLMGEPERIIHTLGTGTPLWMAPEVPTGNYSFPADIYSLGLVLYELFEQKLPIWNDSTKKTTLPAAFLSANFIMRLVDNNPLSRPTADRVVAALDDIIRKTVSSVYNILPANEKAFLLNEKDMPESYGKDKLELFLMQLYRHLLSRPPHDVDDLITRSMHQTQNEQDRDREKLRRIEQERIRIAEQERLQEKLRKLEIEKSRPLDRPVASRTDAERRSDPEIRKMDAAEQHRVSTKEINRKSEHVATELLPPAHRSRMDIERSNTADPHRKSEPPPVEHHRKGEPQAQAPVVDHRKIEEHRKIENPTLEPPHRTKQEPERTKTEPTRFSPDRPRDPHLSRLSPDRSSRHESERNLKENIKVREAKEHQFKLLLDNNSNRGEQIDRSHPKSKASKKIISPRNEKSPRYSKFSSTEDLEFSIAPDTIPLNSPSDKKTLYAKHSDHTRQSVGYLKPDVNISRQYSEGKIMELKPTVFNVVLDGDSKDEEEDPLTLEEDGDKDPKKSRKSKKDPRKSKNRTMKTQKEPKRKENRRSLPNHNNLLIQGGGTLDSSQN